MNGDEAKRIYDKLDELGRGQASLKTSVEHATKRHGDEIKKLFEKLDQQDVRLRKVEITYVTASAHKTDMDGNRQEHREFRDGLDDQRSFSGRIAGGVAVAVAGLGVVAAIVGGVVWLVGKL